MGIPNIQLVGTVPTDQIPAVIAKQETVYTGTVTEGSDGQHIGRTGVSVGGTAQSILRFRDPGTGRIGAGKGLQSQSDGAEPVSFLQKIQRGRGKVAGLIDECLLIIVLNFPGGLEKIKCQGNGRRKGHREQGNQTAGTILPLTLPQIVITTAEDGSCQPGQFNLLCLSWTQTVITAQGLPPLYQHGGNYVCRFTLCQNDENLVDGMGFQKNLDLPLNPLGFCGAGRTDHDQIVGIFQSFPNIIA